MTPKLLVAGVGNIFLGDDAFGSEVARRLLTRHWPEEVRVADFGIRGLDLTYSLLDGYEAVILIDAAPRGGPPGTLYTIEPEVREEDEAPALETHGMNLMRVLAAARSLGGRWSRLILVGCEPSPESADPDGPGQIGLSHAVAGALEEAVKLVEELIWTLQSSPKSSAARCWD